MTLPEAHAAIARCEAEQRRMIQDAEHGTMPAWLVTLGLEDWEMEKRLILLELSRQAPASPRQGSLARLSARA